MTTTTATPDRSIEIRRARTRLFHADPNDPAAVREAQRDYLDLVFPRQRGKRAQFRLEMQEATTA